MKDSLIVKYFTSSLAAGETCSKLLLYRLHVAIDSLIMLILSHNRYCMEAVFKQFVSEKQIEEVKQKRQEEWEKVRRPDQPLGKKLY